jgi:hypothetical protein
VSIADTNEAAREPAILASFFCSSEIRSSPLSTVFRAWRVVEMLADRAGTSKSDMVCESEGNLLGINRGEKVWLRGDLGSNLCGVVEESECALILCRDLKNQIPSLNTIRSLVLSLRFLLLNSDRCRTRFKEL